MKPFRIDRWLHLNFSHRDKARSRICQPPQLQDSARKPEMSLVVRDNTTARNGQLQHVNGGGHQQDDDSSRAYNPPPSSFSSPKQQNFGDRGPNGLADFFSNEVFQIVLHNPTTAHRLSKFSQARMCGENMEFLEKVRVQRRLSFRC